MKFIKFIIKLFFGRFSVSQIILPKKRKKPRKLKKCYVNNKIMFTESMAKQKAKRYKKSEYMRAYRCEFCNSWHLTHHKRYKW